MSGVHMSDGSHCSAVLGSLMEVVVDAHRVPVVQFARFGSRTGQLGYAFF